MLGFRTKLSATVCVRIRFRRKASLGVLGLSAFAVVVRLSPMEMAEVLGSGQLSEQNEGQDVGEESGLH